MHSDTRSFKEASKMGKVAYEVVGSEKLAERTSADAVHRTCAEGRQSS